MSNNINVIRDIQQDKVLSACGGSSNYSFLVNNSDDINFRKIADDLSYADPLRIVESNGKLWAVVHHTVYDKYLRSEMYSGDINKGIPRTSISTAVMSGIAAIEGSWIKRLVNEIREIKQARWTGNKKSTGLLPVSVTEVNV